MTVCLIKHQVNFHYIQRRKGNLSNIFRIRKKGKKIRILLHQRASFYLSDITLSFTVEQRLKKEANDGHKLLSLKECIKKGRKKFNPCKP